MIIFSHFFFSCCYWGHQPLLGAQTKLSGGPAVVNVVDDYNSVSLYMAQKRSLIKSDRPLTRHTLTPPDYWQTDNSSGLVMVIRNYRWLKSASRVLISSSSAPLQFKRESVSKHTLFDLDLWPTTLTYNHRLAKVKFDPHAKNQGQRSNGSTGERSQTNGHTHTHTHGRYKTYYLPWYAGDNQFETKRIKQNTVPSRSQIIITVHDPLTHYLKRGRWKCESGKYSSDNVWKAVKPENS